MYKSSFSFVKVALILGPLLAACAPLPKVELNAYTSAYSETQAVTNSVLDIIAPYERAVIRKAAHAQMVVRTGKVPPNVPSPCTDQIDPSHPYCYNVRSGYADIGDPPLVAAYRNLSDVIARFNSLMVAYANGVTGPLLKQDLDGLATSVTNLTKLAPIANTSSAGAKASFATMVTELTAIGNFVGPFVDRAQLRAFLTKNYHLVNKAMKVMAERSPELYANVAIGTSLFRREAKSKAESQALVARQKNIRRLIANWTVLLGESRRLLGELDEAITNPNSLETRLRNLNGSQIATRVDASAIKKEIAALGAPTPSP